MAIVTDIDETFLDNSPFEAYCAKQGISYSQKAWEEWTVLGEAKPLTGALEFFKYADSKGVAIFYVTNRLEKEREGTAKKPKKNTTSLYLLITTLFCVLQKKVKKIADCKSPKITTSYS